MWFDSQPCMKAYQTQVASAPRVTAELIAHLQSSQGLVYNTPGVVQPLNTKLEPFSLNCPQEFLKGQDFFGFQTCISGANCSGHQSNRG